MKSMASMLARLLLLGVVVPCFGVRLAVKRAAVRNPVLKVVDLLNGLSKTAEAELEKEKDLYEKFTCSSKQSIGEKEELITSAKSRISMLESRIAEIEAGKPATVQEEEQLKGELETLKSELAEADKTHKDEKASASEKAEELKQGIEGIKAAISEISEGHTAGEAGLLSLRAGARSRAKQASLKKALELSDEHLSKADADAVRALLARHASATGLVVKLSGSAAATPEARTAEISKTLGGLGDQLAASLEETQKESEESTQTHAKLQASKAEQEKAVEEAFSKLKLRAAERLKELADAKEELDHLREQVKVGEAFISDVQKGMEDKEKEHNEAETLRQDEITAISQAVAILQSDEARDTLRRSFSLLQAASDSNGEMRRKVAELLLSAGTKSQDRRLLELSKQLSAASDGHFDNVLEKIEKMKKLLQTEKEEHSKKKEDCKEALVSDKKEKEAAESSIQDIQATVESLKDQLDMVGSNLEDKETEAEALKEELEKAQKLREEEQQAHLKAKGDDQSALLLLQQATKQISDFYGGGSKEGTGAQASGVVATMEMVADDVKKNMDLAEKEEESAQSLFEKTHKSLLKQKEQLESMSLSLTGQKGEKGKELQDSKSELGNAQGRLEALELKMKALKKQCDSVVNNFDTRQSNLQDEIEGLDKAKMVLENASPTVSK